jgi:hypothetical protein
MSVQLFIWEIPKRNIPLAILKMATNHIYLRRTKSITFYKLLGTGRGETFTLNDANLKSWALLVVGSDQRSSGIVKRWRNISSHERSYELSPISAHGSWSGKQPFEVSELKNSESEIAVITRARIKFKLSKAFWSSVPPVVKSLKSSPGLKMSIGIGEAPIGLQGTFSIWENASALEKFAFKGEEHSRVIKRTRELGWYSEELFSRFEVISKAE